MASSTDPVLSLLNYTVSTSPLPLQISKSGTITVVADNPGGYNDRPEQDYVSVDSIVLDFGLKGSGGSNLCTVDGSSWAVIAPAGWTPPTVSGLKFTFTPPTGKEKIFPSAGLQFSFAQIPVNATVGTVTLTIGETASSPGDPAEPDFYPPQPRALRERKRPIGKFPIDFSVSDLTATPPEVPVDGSTVLSWVGSPGAIYEITYGGKRVTKYADGTLLQPNDRFPNTTAGDPPLTVHNRTTFTLTVTYTPPGGSDPAIVQRQVTVSVYYPEPTISLFTATPEFIQVPAGSPSVVTLSWEVKNGRKPDCVAFTVTPPLPTYPATGTGLRHEIKSSQPITLTAYGGEGTTPVSQTKDILIARTATIADGIGKDSRYLTVSPDGRYAFVLNLASESVSVITTPGSDIATWKTIATLTGLPRNPSSIGFVASSVGQFLLVTNSDFSAGALTVFTVTNAAPSQWPRVGLKSGMSAIAGGISATPSGAYVFVSCDGYMGSPSAAAIFTVNSSNPQQWPLFNLKLSDPALMLRSVNVSPLGDYACILAVRNYRDQLWVVSLNCSDPAQWPVKRISPEFEDLSTGVSFSPDRKLGLVTNFNNRCVFVLDLSATDPTQWRVMGKITQGLGQPMYAVFSADGAYVFASNPLGNFVTVLKVSAEPPEKWAALRLTQGAGPAPSEIAATKGNVTLIANANNQYSAGSLTAVTIEPPLPKTQTEVKTPAEFRRKRVANEDGLT
jgi:hypothetical protein